MAMGALAASAFPSGSWQTLQYLPSGISITDIAFMDDGLHGMACGYLGSAGYVFHTTDCGQVWTASMIESGHNLQAVSTASPVNAWVVGQDGYIFSTTNGGYTWTQQASGTTRDLLDVCFINVNVGWIVGGNGDGSSYLVLSTINGGATWTSHSFGSDCISVNSVYFADAFNGWMGGRSSDGPHIHRTLDGGSTWTRQTLPGLDQDAAITGISFSGGAQGWAATSQSASSGAILHTSNSGATWDLQYTTSKAHGNVVALDAQNVAAAGSTPHSAYVTADGGATWTEHSTGLSGTGTAIEYEGGRIWVGGPNSTILASDDGGDSWTGQISSVPLGNMDWGTQSVGWIVAGKTQQAYTRVTTDGGATWVAAPGNPGGLVVQFVNAASGWMLWDGNGPAVWRTTNGGTNWTYASAGYSSQASTYGMFRACVDTGWVYGGAGIIRRSVNGGATWTTQNLNTARNVMDVRFINHLIGWAAGGNSSGGQPFMRRTANAGATWSSQTLPVSSSVISLWPINSSKCWGLCQNGQVIATSDAGATWSVISQLSGTGASIYMYDSLTGWVAMTSGSNSVVYRTDDGGITWTQDWSTPAGLIHSGFAPRPDNGAPWVCGDNMLIAKWVQGTGFEGGSGPGPLAGRLAVSPNPANSEATVAFQAQSPGDALLRVYDVSGRLVHESDLGEVTTSETQARLGTSSYPSGLYFCTICVGADTMKGSFLVVR